MQQVNFYPRPPRGGRPPLRVALAALRAISIHALREEGDPCTPRATAGRLNFYPRPPRGGRRSTHIRFPKGTVISIHALREEGDLSTSVSLPRAKEFLSTPSARRATDADTLLVCKQLDFYPRPPRGGRPAPTSISDPERRISIHALREEGDTQREKAERAAIKFLSTPSARRATKGVTIHNTNDLFLSTPSARRATAVRFCSTTNAEFLSTPSARRATSAWTAAPPSRQNFYPRPPRGGRPILVSP